MSRRLLLALSLATFAVSPVAAQNLVSVGQRVRVRDDSSWKGSVQSVSADSIRIAVEGGGTRSLPAERFASLQVSDGRRISRTTTAAIGSAVGGGLGLAAGLLGASDCEVKPEDDILGFGAGLCASVNQAMMFALPVAGILAGAGIGALFGGGERWRSVRTAPTVSVGRSAEGAYALQVGLTF